MAYTVVDASRVPPDTMADLVRASSLTLLIIELAVVDIRTAKSMLQALRDRNEGGDVVPVANRWSRRQTSPDLQDARDALGREVLTISNDFTAALKPGGRLCTLKCFVRSRARSIRSSSRARRSS